MVKKNKKNTFKKNLINVLVIIATSTIIVAGVLLTLKIPAVRTFILK